MADPNLVAAGAIASGAGIAAVSFAAAFLNALGIDTGTIFLAMCGAFVGLSLPGHKSRLSALSVFVPVVVMCAVFGSWWGETPASKNFAAAASAVLFHVVLTAVVSRVPRALDGLMRRYGMHDDPPKEKTE